MLKDILSRKLKTLWNSKDGVISVEFAIISPFIITAILIASNTAFTIVNHQKLAAAVNTSATYLQDTVAEAGTGGIGQKEYDELGRQIDNRLKRTAKVIVEEAFGKEIKGAGADVNFYCACPPPVSDYRGIYEGDKPYYNYTSVSMGNGSDVCPQECEGFTNEPQRVLAEISVSYDSYNLFGQKKTISESIVTRLQ